jgi:hypothetical protein
MSVLSTRGLLGLLLLTGSVVACQSAPADTDEPVGAAEQRAVVTPEQADRAYTIVSGIDYLPWHYTADGCYARALYMSMELAIERIPSSSQYIYATNGGSLRPVNGPVWGWHVAPMIKVTATGTPMIIDPSVFSAPEVVRSLDAWVTRNNPTPAEDYGVALVQGSHYWQINQLVDTQPISSFAELDPFQGKDIESACEIMYNYLADETPAPTEAALTRKRGELVDRTKKLITGLQNVEKLSDLTAATLSCGGHANGTAAPNENGNENNVETAPADQP